MIYGSKIGLRAIEKNDLNYLRDWRNNPDFRKYFREWKEISEIEQYNWFDYVTKNKTESIMFSIIDLKEKQLIGCCGFTYLNWTIRSAELSIYIGFNDLYIDKVLALDACKVLFNYGFFELNFNKIWAEIYEFDDKKIDLFDSLSMKLDGKLRQNCFYNGTFYDSLCYSILYDEWKV